MIKNRLKQFIPFTIALLLGAILTLAFAPYDIFPLAIVIPAGLLTLWLNTTPRHAFWLGFLFGCGFFGSGVYWVYISIHVIGEVPFLLAITITAIFIAALALFPATVGYLLNRYFSCLNTTKILFAFPAIWVVSEWIRSFILTGFPWLILGYSQTNSPLKGIAPLLGVYGVSLAVLMSSALITLTALRFKQKNYPAGYKSLFALGVMWLISSLCTFIPWTQPEDKPIPVALVQGDIPQAIKWSPEHVKLSFDRYLSLTEPLWSKNQLIIWPEAAIPVPLQNARDFIDELDEKAIQNSSHLILGIPIQAGKNSYYNAIVALGEDKKVYIKRRLVPFGEYTPFSQFFAQAFNFMDIPMSDMVPGRLAQPPFIIGGIKILPTICYEIAFPDLVRTYDASIGFLLTVTNDAWFGKSNAQAQHLQMAAMRALEFGRPVLFVSNDGITAMLSPDGKIATQAPPYTPFVLKASIQPAYGLTPWMRNGSDPVLFILICLLGTAIRFRNKAIIANQTTVSVIVTDPKN